MVVFDELLNILVPIYSCVGLGLVLGRWGFPWEPRVIARALLR